MLGRERPGVSNRPVDPLGELLVGFQVLLTRGLLGCILYSVDPEYPSTCSTDSTSPSSMRHPAAEAAATPARDSLQVLAADLRAFARARDWEQYRTPKNLARPQPER